MKILIQDRRTRHYLGMDGQWQADPEIARGFDRGGDCINHCMDKGIENYQLVFNFGNPALDIVHPISRGKG